MTQENHFEQNNRTGETIAEAEPSLNAVLQEFSLPIRDLLRAPGDSLFYAENSEVVRALKARLEPFLANEKGRIGVMREINTWLMENADKTKDEPAHATYDHISNKLWIKVNE